MTIRVVIADDQVLLRGTLRLLLENAAGFEVTGEASDGAEAVEVVRGGATDVVLMDLRMPRVDGLQAIRAIRDDTALDDVKILVLTTFESEQYVAEALQAGANGFVGKGTDPRELLLAIETVARGDVMLSPAATRALVAVFTRSAAPVPQAAQQRFDALTPRELEMVVLVAGGITNDEIAARLSLSRHTVKTHINRAMVKLGVSDRAQLVVLAYESGLVTPSGRPRSQ
ncbi:response regulator transcription factor [Streptomyces mangrovisoli]|uniref:DNA-binding response regulator n=1 Tax=Streptomyces mangrovisoli TaxID=1428628 RepID=A0A1J4NV39_9ACTN|nr:response regulator transcription factor [Streptomyces mangrovisoli]OIJ65388.1 DNA-binding response regulator [Streptomyces mangrovisoli]